MTPARALGLGLLLTATAGFVDAIGFVALGGYYTSFMSGNTTQLGAGIANGAWAALALPLGLIVLFFVGSVAGTLIASMSRRWGPAMTLGCVIAAIAATLGLSLAGFGPHQSMLVLAGAAGAQNAVLQPIGAARLGTTFVTGTLFAAGQDLARALRREAPSARWLQHLMVWAALCAGALGGAVGYSLWGMLALGIPAASYAVCLVSVSLRAPR